VTIFQTFSCHDVGSQDEEEEYMTADYSVSCASERYAFAFWWAVAMVFVYPIGRQSLFGWVIHTMKASTLLIHTMNGDADAVGWMYVLLLFFTVLIEGIPLSYFVLLYTSKAKMGSEAMETDVVYMLCDDYTRQCWYVLG